MFIIITCGCCLHRILYPSSFHIAVRNANHSATAAAKFYLMSKKLQKNIIEAASCSKHVWISRTPIIPFNTPSEIQRLQVPVALELAITINKGHNKSLKYCLYLDMDILAQIYVAYSNLGRPHNIFICVSFSVYATGKCHSEALWEQLFGTFLRQLKKKFIFHNPKVRLLKKR